jgi:hypothetical protein
VSDHAPLASQISVRLSNVKVLWASESSGRRSCFVQYQYVARSAFIKLVESHFVVFMMKLFFNSSVMNIGEPSIAGGL